MERHQNHPPRCAGFTLIELLVALAILAIMAALGWRGLDAMVRTQQQVRERADEILALQAGLGQWQADLDALVETGVVSALDYDGRVLRLTRRDALDLAAGVRVAAWSSRVIDGRRMWLRWQSAPLRTRAQVNEAWARAQLWARNPGEADRRLEVAVVPVDDMQIFYFRGDAWTNPLSSDTTANVTAPSAIGRQIDIAVSSTTLATLPDGVRLLLRVANGQAIAGPISRDWVRPVIGGGKS